MATDKLSQKIFDLYEYVEALKSRDVDDPDKSAEILSGAIEELQARL